MESGDGIYPSRHSARYGHLRHLRRPMEYQALFKILHVFVFEARERFISINPTFMRHFAIGKDTKVVDLGVNAQYRQLALFRMWYGLTIRRHSGTTQLLPRNSEDARSCSSSLSKSGTRKSARLSFLSATKQPPCGIPLARSPFATETSFA